MSEKHKSSHSPKSTDTLIGAGVRIEGDIACAGVLRVQGDIVGNVSCNDAPNGALIVDGAGSVTGTVSATHVFVRGRVVGPVRSAESIEIHDGASLVGDVSFNRIAIHAGGVVDGMLNRSAAEAVLSERPLQAANAAAAAGGASAGSGSLGLAGTWKVAGILLLAVAVAAGVWARRNAESSGRPVGEVASAADLASRDAAMTAPLRAATEPSTNVPKIEDAQPAASPPSAPVLSPEPVQAAAPAANEASQEKVVAVRGINPSRPASVFLLVSNDPSVLYRKKRGDSGEGMRVSVPGGEKASVAIAPGELIRVAQGRDVVILFQGAKVPKPVIESGAWISFVPR